MSVQCSYAWRLDDWPGKNDPRVEVWAGWCVGAVNCVQCRRANMQQERWLRRQDPFPTKAAAGEQGVGRRTWARVRAEVVG